MTSPCKTSFLIISRGRTLVYPLLIFLQILSLPAVRRMLSLGCPQYPYRLHQMSRPRATPTVLEAHHTSRMLSQLELLSAVFSPRLFWRWALTLLFIKEEEGLLNTQSLGAKESFRPTTWTTRQGAWARKSLIRRPLQKLRMLGQCWNSRGGVPPSKSRAEARKSSRHRPTCRPCPNSWQQSIRKEA